MLVTNRLNSWIEHRKFVLKTCMCIIEGIFEKFPVPHRLIELARESKKIDIINLAR